MTTVMYALISGPDIEYFAAEGHALDRLRFSAFVEKYVCEDGRVFHKEGVYRMTPDGGIVYTTLARFESDGKSVD